MNEREYNLSQMQSALRPLKTINDLYDTAISMNQQRTAEVMRVTSQREAGRKDAILSMGAMSLITVIFGIGGVFAPLMGEKFDLFGFLVGLVLLIAFVPVMKRYKAKLDRARNIKPVVEPYDDALSDISREIEQTATQYSKEIAALPRDYRSYDAVSFFEHAFANYRANTITEAVNLYETHLHQKRQEEQSRLLLIDSQRQSEMLESIERSSRQAAAASTVSAAFSVLNFLSRV